MKLSWTSYIRYLRKRPAHLQRLHALVFAGTLTALITGVVLYSQYGYFHEVYTREEVATQEAPQVAASPEVSLLRLFQEAKERFKNTISESKMTGREEADMAYDRTQIQASSTPK